MCYIINHKPSINRNVQVKYQFFVDHDPLLFVERCDRIFYLVSRTFTLSALRQHRHVLPYDVCRLPNIIRLIGIPQRRYIWDGRYQVCLPKGRYNCVSRMIEFSSASMYPLYPYTLSFFSFLFFLVVASTVTVLLHSIRLPCPLTLPDQK